MRWLWACRPQGHAEHEACHVVSEADQGVKITEGHDAA